MRCVNLQGTTFYVLRILNNPLRVFIGKRDSKNIKLK